MRRKYTLFFRKEEKRMLTLDKVMVDAEPIGSAEPLAAGVAKIRRSGRSRLPVSDSDGRYVGMLAAGAYAQLEAACADEATPAEPVAAADSPTALLRLFAEQDADTVAVVDRGGQTVGVADRQLTLKLTASLLGADTPGATIAVAMRAADYEIGRLATTIEMAGARILSITSSADAYTATAYVRIAQPDPFPVIESLERHGYDATAYSGSYALSEGDDILRRNYDSLMDYLKI